MSEIKLSDSEHEEAASLFVDLWEVFHSHRIYEDSMRDVVSVSKLAIYSTLALTRSERALAAITDGPYDPTNTRSTRYLFNPDRCNPLRKVQRA